jgi:predicted NACHT family NTPase
MDAALAMERSATGARPEEMTEVRMRAAQGAEDLLGRLRQAPALADLTVNPLLLTMIASVHRYRGALPGTRADLYGEICQVMLSRRVQAKNLPEQLPWPVKEKLLGVLAFQMMTAHLRDLPREQVLEVLGPGLARNRQKVTGSDFLADVASNGLLVEREHGLYAFAHLTFQEYLAARHILANNRVDVLTRAVEDNWWRETTLLYTATADADPIVRACLDNGTHMGLLPVPLSGIWGHRKHVGLGSGSTDLGVCVARPSWMLLRECGFRIP